MPVYCDLKAMTETLLFEEPAASAVILSTLSCPATPVELAR